jgi:hypothetical protein
MPQRSHEWLQRIKDVEREYAVARLATDRLLADAERDPAVLLSELRPRDVHRAAGRLEGTYIVRLFAEFETGLRQFWQAARQSEPPARTRDLLDGLAATRQIPHDVLSRAHAVREYRNHLVHERDDEVTVVGIGVARRGLCIYFSFLPIQW